MTKNVKKVDEGKDVSQNHPTLPPLKPKIVSDRTARSIERRKDILSSSVKVALTSLIDAVRIRLVERQENFADLILSGRVILGNLLGFCFAVLSLES